MTPTDLRTALLRLCLTQTALARKMRELGDHRALETILRSISNQCRGVTSVSGEMAVVVALLELTQVPRKAGPPAGKRLVLLESPYAGHVERNVAYARRCLRDSLLRGEAPIASHLLYTQPGVFNDLVPAERSLGIDAGHAWHRVADCSVVYTDLGISPGMRRGMELAAESGIPCEERQLYGALAGGAPPNPEDGLLSAHEPSRTSPAYGSWRAAVLSRDGYSCQDCGASDRALQAHHRLPFATHPEAAFDLSNGVTLCGPCHRQAHGERVLPSNPADQE